MLERDTEVYAAMGITVCALIDFNGCLKVLFDSLWLSSVYMYGADII
jgi:hypothetical protein